MGNEVSLVPALRVPLISGRRPVAPADEDFSRRTARGRRQALD
jgi:hypothetical protein